MKKIELLSPVGNIDTLKQAIHNGADAVYLGGKKFGARAFSKNFTEEELTFAIKYCHLYGVKIYITVNTIIFDDEIDEFINYIKFLHESGVDAVIMQDIGLIKKVKTLFPNLEIHASTQSHVHSTDVVKYLKDLGVERVVFARELSLQEINDINIDIEKEVFIHGALCISYSGCCLFSSMNGKRSGNRGECVGNCRLPYELIENDKKIQTEGQYLLSTKELCSINNLKDILDSNIDSLKIEGRMKSSEYVGYVTRLYRMLIDKYYENKDLSITKEEFKNLKKLFNREFTKGFISNEEKENITNIKSPNHIGIPIGKVIEENKKIIKILLTEDLEQEDGIRFSIQNKGMIINKLYDNNMKLVNKVNKNNIAIIDNKINLKNKDNVLKTTDTKLLKELKNITERKIDIDFYIEAKLNDNLKLTIKDDIGNVITGIGPKIEKSLNNPTTEERIISQVEKLGNTPFKSRKTTCTIDNNIFIPIKEINNLRRELTEKLEEIRKNNKKKVIYSKKEQHYQTEEPINKININILVRTEEQLKKAVDKNIDYIYTTDYNLYKKYHEYNNIYLRLDRLSKNNKEYHNERLLVTELGALYYYNLHNDIITDYYLNISNHESYHLIKQKSKRVTLSVEFKPSNYNKYYNAEIIIYGRIELMIMKYCPLKRLINKDKVCKVCKNNNIYYLKDSKNKLYPIINDKETTHIMHYKNINLVNDINNYLNVGIRNFRIELFNENEQETEQIIDLVQSKLKR